MRNYTTPEKSIKRSPSRSFTSHTSPSLPIDAPLLHNADTPVKDRPASTATESTVRCLSWRSAVVLLVVTVSLIAWFGQPIACEAVQGLCTSRCVNSQLHARLVKQRSQQVSS